MHDGNHNKVQSQQLAIFIHSINLWICNKMIKSNTNMFQNNI